MLRALFKQGSFWTITNEKTFRDLGSGFMKRTIKYKTEAERKEARRLATARYRKTEKLQPLLIVNLNELIEDLSVFCKKVSVVNNNVTANVDRKHLLIKF